MTEKQKPSYDGGIGVLPDGTLNIGTPDQMKEKFDEAKLEAEEAEKGDDLGDLGDVEAAFGA